VRHHERADASGLANADAPTFLSERQHGRAPVKGGMPPVPPGLAPNHTFLRSD
jgi:hypothetical protein